MDKKDLSVIVDKPGLFSLSTIEIECVYASVFQTWQLCGVIWGIWGIEVHPF